MRVAPLWWVALFSAVFLTALVGVPALFASLAGATPRETLWPLSAVPVLTAFVAAVTAWERRRDRRAAGDHSRAAWLEMARALRTGEPPDDTALDGPLLALIARTREQRRQGWWGAALVAVVLVAAAGLAGWGAAGTAALTFLFVLLWARRLVARQRRLEERLRARAKGSASARG
ncbi:hypothetical protein ACSNOI_25140 [Actinomadura kijaniata]|uniref:hypothetical protein n=1 Tax=Actinomadura kijaniata TaxID=46161 RepID=UPI003F1CC24E